VKEAYLKEVAEKEYNYRAERYRELNDVILKAEGTLATKRDNLLKINPKAHLTDPKQGHEAQGVEFQDWVQLRQQGTLLKREIDAVLSLLAAQQAKLGSKEGAFKVPEALIVAQLDAEPSVVALEHEVLKIELQVEEERRSLKQGVPRDESLRKLKTAKDHLDSHKTKLRPKVEKKLGDRLQSETQQQIKDYEARLQYLKAQQKELQDAIDKAKLAVENLGRIKMSGEELTIRAEIEQQENVIRIARSEKERLFVEMQSQSRRIREEEPVQVPQHRNWRPQLMSASLVGSWGLLLGLVGVSYREYRTRRISGKEEVAHHLNLLVFGSLPLVASKSRTGLLPFVSRRKYDWDAVLRESVDSIRATLMRNERTESRRLLLVTSPRSGEGKTTLSVHLAASIARGGRKTLLVDADLHHPSVHRIFALEGKPGLGDVLRGEVDLGKAVQAGPLENFFILPAGVPGEGGTHLFMRPTATELFVRLRQEFEYVIFDCSPVLPVVDALLVGAHTDGVILSVRRRVSQLLPLQEACERLYAARIAVLGAVLNGVDVADYGVTYPYYAESSD
jgi:capsular exopolysaccharide synthesis family protein